VSKNPDRQLEAGMQELEQKRAEGIERWVSEKLGGTVVASERLARWRPLWKVRYRTREGEERSALVRGDRPIASLFSLEHEMRVMQALAANGVKVPRLLGWSDFPKAFVMDWVETGVDRDPGMIHTAIDRPTGMTDERWQAMLAYMEGLARIHAIPIGEFRAIEGYLEPKTPEDVALNMIERQVRFAREHGLDDPIFAFLISWLRRHVPRHRRTASFVTGDAGQFMSRGAEVAAYVDFEIAHIGDTHWDLACFRGRHPYEHMGDIPVLYRHYAAASGTEVDLPVVGYHTASFLLFAAIAARAFMEPDARDSNWIEGVFEYASCARRALEAIAELEGVALDFDLHLPEPRLDPLAESGLQKLLNDVERLPVSHAFAAWERDLLGAIPRFLLHQSRYGHWLDEETIREISGVTGSAHAGLAEADAAIVAVVEKGDAARDAELLRIMHRRILRFSMLTAGSDPTDRNPLFFRLEPILDRGA
jgi:aminoglycoside phosphotransferase (APT) family kinase protein